MTKIGVYPYHAFDDKGIVHIVTPDIQLSVEDEEYHFRLSATHNQDTVHCSVLLSQEQLDLEYQQMTVGEAHTNIKTYYAQNLPKIAQAFTQIFKQFNLSLTYKRSNLRFLHDGEQRSTLYTYLLNDNGRLKVETLFFSNDGKQYPYMNTSISLSLAGRLYPVEFTKTHKTFHTERNAIKVFNASGYVLDVVGMSSPISDPPVADKHADDVLDFLENHLSNNIEPDVSPFIQTRVKKMRALDIEL